MGILVSILGRSLGLTSALSPPATALATRGVVTISRNPKNAWQKKKTKLLRPTAPRGAAPSLPTIAAGHACFNLQNLNACILCNVVLGIKISMYWLHLTIQLPQSMAFNEKFQQHILGMCTSVEKDAPVSITCMAGSRNTAPKAGMRSVRISASLWLMRTPPRTSTSLLEEAENAKPRLNLIFGFWQD